MRMLLKLITYLIMRTSISTNKQLPVVRYKSFDASIKEKVLHIIWIEKNEITTKQLISLKRKYSWNKCSFEMELTNHTQKNKID